MILKRNHIIQVLLAVIILFSNILNYTTVKAGDWGIIQDSGKTFTKKTISWRQTHHIGADDKVRYYTYKYAVTKEELETKYSFYHKNILFYSKCLAKRKSSSISILDQRLSPLRS